MAVCEKPGRGGRKRGVLRRMRYVGMYRRDALLLEVFYGKRKKLYPGKGRYGSLQPEPAVLDMSDRCRIDVAVGNRYRILM